VSDTEDLARALARAGDADDRQLRQLLGHVTRSAKGAGLKAVTSGKWLAEVALEVAAHVNARDLATLREHHGGLAGPLLARTLIRNASRTSAAVGAATGALAAASETTPATWGTLPIELLAETLVVVAVEMKLVAELHEAAGIALPTSLGEKGLVVSRAWAESRGVRPQDVLDTVRSGGAVSPLTGNVVGLVGRTAGDQVIVQALQRRIIRRTGRNVLSLTPLLIGALAGAALNGRATRKIGTDVAVSLGITPPR
jgi:hypothetical protein